MKQERNWNMDRAGEFAWEGISSCFNNTVLSIVYTYTVYYCTVGGCYVTSQDTASYLVKNDTIIVAIQLVIA